MTKAGRATVRCFEASSAPGTTTEMVSGARVLYSKDVGSRTARVCSSSTVTTSLLPDKVASTVDSHAPSANSFDCIE